MKKLMALFLSVFIATTVMAATKPAPVAPVLSGTMVNGVRVITVAAKKYEFIPNPIVVNVGEKVLLKITATDVDHGIGIKEFKIEQKLPKGSEQAIGFTPDKTGTFTINCTEWCGLGHMAMKGKFIVLPVIKK